MLNCGCRPKYRISNDSKLYSIENKTMTFFVKRGNVGREDFKLCTYSSCIEKEIPVPMSYHPDFLALFVSQSCTSNTCLKITIRFPPLASYTLKFVSDEMTPNLITTKKTRFLALFVSQSYTSNKVTTMIQIVRGLTNFPVLERD